MVYELLDGEVLVTERLLKAEAKHFVLTEDQKKGPLRLEKA